jgi:hypothetical protein
VKKILLVFVVWVGIVPFTSAAWGVSWYDAHERQLEKRDMNFGRRPEPKQKAEEAESGTEDALSRLQELSDERDQEIEQSERAFEEAYEAQKEVIRSVGK